MIISLPAVFRLRDCSFPFDEFVVQTIRTLLLSARAGLGNHPSSRPTAAFDLTCPRTYLANLAPSPKPLYPWSADVTPRRPRKKRDTRNTPRIKPSNDGPRRVGQAVWPPCLSAASLAAGVVPRSSAPEDPAANQVGLGFRAMMQVATGPSGAGPPASEAVQNGSGTPRKLCSTVPRL